jgi:NitT/TauT family transport system substrate-binding protein
MTRDTHNRRGRRGHDRTRTLLALITALVLGVLGATVAGASAMSAQRAADPTIVHVAVLPIEPTAQAFYAKHRGFFLREGIDARITVLADPSQIAAAVLSGDAQFSSFSTGGLAILKSRGAPVKLVAAGAIYRPTAPTSALVAGPGRRITRPQDLVGKRVAIDAQNTLAHVGLLKWLKRGGVPASDVRLAEMPFAQMLGPLRRSDVDAAVLPEPFVTLATQRGASIVAPILDAVCRQDCLLTVFMARRDIDPNLAARFRNAVQAAAVWANRKENASASGKILARYAPIDSTVIGKMTRTSFSQRLRTGLAQPWIDAFAEFGVIPTSFRAIDLAT